MTTAREIMSGAPEYAKSDATVKDVARMLADSEIGAVPVCDASGHLEGVVTDRDIVVKVIAANKDPESTMLSEITDQDEVVTIGADDSLEEAVETMKRHKVRRLPVIDGDKLVGMVSQADLARVLPKDKVGDLVEVISAA